MPVTIEYVAQLKRAAGNATESLEITENQSLSNVSRNLCEQDGESLANILLTPADEISPTLLLFLNDEQISLDENQLIQDGDTLTISTPISGG